MRLYFFVLVFLINNISFSQDKDLQILNRLIDKALRPIQDFFDADSIKNIKLNIISQEETLRDLIRIKLLKTVSEDSNSNYDLDILINKSEITFPEIIAFPLFGDKKLKREITLDMTSILSKNGIKIRSFDFNETITDTIDLSQFASGNLPEKIKLPKVPLYRSLVEPAIISAVTGIIVYLFFIIRSK